MSDLELVPQSMPAAHDLVGMLRANLDALVERERVSRGEVHAPEDTYGMVLRLTGLHEGLESYARAFRTIAGEARGYVQDELELAVGEQEGIPRSGMNVPDPDGTTVKVELDVKNAYTFDTEALLDAVVGETLAWMDGGDPNELVEPAQALRHALDVLLTCGRFEPQVSKLRAFTDAVARHSPAAASTVTQGTRRTRRFLGVKLTREQPKKKG